MYLNEKLKEADKELNCFEILDKRNVWIVSVYRNDKLEYAVQGPNLPYLYRNVIEKYNVKIK